MYCLISPFFWVVPTLSARSAGLPAFTLDILEAGPFYTRAQAPLSPIDRRGQASSGINGGEQ